MPLYDFSCPSHGTFEAFSRAGATVASGPDCDKQSDRQFSVTSFPRVHRPYDKQVDDRLPSTDRAQVIDRAGGGRAAVVSETGGYRPMVTHNTVCPSEKKWRNVAVLANLPYGKRLNCEACGYVWVYQAATAGCPLQPGVEESYRPGRTIHMNPAVPLHSGYRAPERGG